MNQSVIPINEEALSEMPSEERTRFLEAVKRETSSSVAQLFLSSLFDKCSAKCLRGEPGLQLLGKDRGCLRQCVARFTESWAIVWAALQQRSQQSRQAGIGSKIDEEWWM